MNGVARILCAFLWLLPSAHAAEQKNSWFKPVLVENRSPICAAALEEAERIFYSPAARLDLEPLRLAGMQAVDPDRDFALEQVTEPNPNTGEPMERTQASIITRGKKIYVAVATIPGCGGACEGRQMYAAAEPFEPPIWADVPNSARRAPAAAAFTLLKSQDDRLHVAMVADEQLQLFTLTDTVDWDGVCKVDLQPQDLYGNPDGELQAAVKSIGDLQSTIDPIRQGAGHDCGTLRAHERGGPAMNDKFRQALYRPWALQRPADDVPSGDGFRQWSLLGIDEYAAMEKFRAQVPLTVSQLAQLYVRKFGWSQADSQAAAETSVAAAIARGFGFSNAPMFGDRSQAVRQAILEHKSVAELEALHWTAVEPKADAFQWNESVLSIAVNHPDALRWLIAKKLDANHANSFGKTPLMYAAQHNSLEAVRILLAAGADPNAATIFPEDTCFYTLSRANVSVLHYAARYGSAAILEALVAAGALTSVTTEQRDETPGQTPLEWLRSSSSNSIAESDRARLEQMLAPQTSEKLAEYSKQQALQAEKHYAAGDLSAALRTLKQALQANPSNQRALSNLSLLSLRAGQYGESLEAATRLLAESKDAGLIANAWFNIGLACERSDRSYLQYNGESYCTSSRIFPFLQSWRATNSRARAEKLEQLLSAPGRERCVVSQPDSTEHRYVFVRGADRDDTRGPDVQRIYVLHPAGSTVSAAQVHWSVTPYVGKNPVPRLVTPRLVSRHPLGRSTITVLESEDTVVPPVSIGDYKCF